MHLQRTQTRSIIEEDWGAVERLERAVVLHVELPEIQARGQLNPEVVCGLSRSQRQVGDNFESLDEPNLDQEFTRCLPVLRRALADVLLLLVVTGQAQRLRVALERRLWPCAGRVKSPEERRPLAPGRVGELGDVSTASSPPTAVAAASSAPAPSPMPPRVADLWRTGCVSPGHSFFRSSSAIRRGSAAQRTPAHEGEI